MGRAPCCDKMGLKKGPWTPEEDTILVSYIQKHGHSNWRALPKLAGLSRCGKSCRLRWINYLRPDIKRGNFTEEEEKTIIQLHEILGNRWSAIAAKLPGRTDNEIKNVWHTHLKKKLPQKNDPKQKNSITKKRVLNSTPKKIKSTPINSSGSPGPPPPLSASRPSFSDENSSVLDASIATSETKEITYVTSENMENSSQTFPMINEDFWPHPELEEISSISPISFNEIQSEFRFNLTDSMELGCLNIDNEMDFWYDLFVQSGGIEEVV